MLLPLEIPMVAIGYSLMTEQRSPSNLRTSAIALRTVAPAVSVMLATYRWAPVVLQISPSR